MNSRNKKPTRSIIFPAILLVFLSSIGTALYAAPAVYDEATRELSASCVEPQIAGSAKLKDNEPITHAVTLVFDEDLKHATATAAVKTPKTEDCTGVFELTTGVYTDQFDYNGETLSMTLKYTGGVTFSVITFLPGAEEETPDPNQLSLWRVSNGANELYIAGVVKVGKSEYTRIIANAGTLNVLRSTDLPLAPEYYEAYGKSDIIVTEVSRDDVSANLAALNQAFGGPNSSLAAELSPDVYDALAARVATYGAEIENLDFLRPHWMAEIIYFIESVLQGYTLAGVEDTFLNLASIHNKPVQSLEPATTATDAENLRVADKSADEIVTEALETTTNGDFFVTLNAILDAWKIGNMGPINDIMVDPIRNDSLEDFAREFTDRYAIWLPEVEDMLDTAETEFVIVNVKHLAGPDSFLKTLEEAGYTVERYIQ